ncbi:MULTISPECIES: ABC transporter substrate-binding protein [unclassified Nitratireductor]|uniref:ABC transporter substrate-binding protein n=1 Tax=unclassified Nitratireductor TaxID=2641084 RepID=UPI0025F4EDBF|nr:ABC transporter substrate-binding protein [Nitratireductor sp.]
MFSQIKRSIAAVALAAVLVGPAAAETLTIAQNFDPQTLWPNGTTASDNLNAGSAMVESLFWQDPRSGEIEPLLATGFELETPTSVLLALREGVTFTNGEPMNADAVVHSIGVFIDKELTPAYAQVAQAFEGAEKVDDLTVRITLKNPYPPLALALSQIYVVPPKHWEEVGLEAFGQQPVGTGPFKFSEWVRDDRLVMELNEDYWGELPKGIDGLVWRPVPDDSARVAGLTTGEYDVVKDLPVAAIPSLEGQEGVTLVPVASYRIYQIGLSSLPQHESPLQDKRVRQALNYAVDQKAIIDALFFGKAKALNGQVLREPQLGFNPQIKDYPYDPEKARALLAEAGYPDGFEITFKFPSGRYAQDREVSEAVAGMLGKVGVKTEMIALEPGEFLRQLRSKELAPMYFVGLAPQDDPAFQASQYVSTWRYTTIANEELDALAEAGAKEMDLEKRRRIYQDMMALMHDEAPIIFLYQGLDLYGTDAKLKNFLPRGDGRMFFYGVTYED